MILKPDKDSPRKEYYRQILLTNIDISILTEILANQIHQCIFFENMTYWVQGCNTYVITLRGIYENDKTIQRE